MPRQWLLARTVDPSVEPVRREELEEHLRIIDSDGEQSNTLERVISAARDAFEVRSDTAVIEQTWLLCLPKIQSRFQLPKPPLVDVVSVQYRDVNGILQPIDPGVYSISTYGRPGVLFANTAEIIPSDIVVNEFWPYPWEIKYTCGYATPDDVPALIRNAILELAGFKYNQREAVEDVPYFDVPHAFEAVCSMYRPHYHMEERAP